MTTQSNTPSVYGYVNGKAVYSRHVFIYESRHRGPIEDDDELLAFAYKVTNGWSFVGRPHTFIRFYLGDYALSEPKASLTYKEYARLRQLQAEAIAREKAAEDDARGWTLQSRFNYADNSVEEIWVDKDGVKKIVTVVPPHGNARRKGGRV